MKLRTPTRTLGFSLIELMVVIAIIAVLAGFSAAGIMKAARSKDDHNARTIAGNVGDAVTRYYNEYDGSYPVEQKGEDYEGTTEDGSMIAVLAGVESQKEMNPRRINFLEGMTMAKKSGSGFKNGIDMDENPDQPRIFDPWGKPYKVRLDTNYDKQMESPDHTTTSNIIRDKRALVWSAGRDGNFETWSDNIKNW